LLVEHDGLSAAILDHALTDGECTNLCARLLERNIPFLRKHTVSLSITHNSLIV